MEDHVKARLHAAAYGAIGGVSAVAGAGIAWGTGAALLVFGVLVYLDGLDWSALARHREMLARMQRDAQRQDGA